MTGIPVTKRGQLKYSRFPRREPPSAIMTSSEGKRTERFSEKSLNLENSLKSKVRFPSSKETHQLLFVTFVTEVSLYSREVESE